MTIKRTLGGDRVRAGKKMQVEMHGFERSNFNLSKKWRSSMAVGTLIPCYTNIGLNGDTFDIDINAQALTIPTKAPVFGTFEMAIDFYVTPLRLYNGELHNNPVGVGTRMRDIPFQTVDIYHAVKTDYKRNHDTCQINESSLLHYLGISGLGVIDQYSEQDQDHRVIKRTFNSTPILAYYDIFKNYYSNKQEKNAYWIGNRKNTNIAKLIKIQGMTPSISQAYTWYPTNNEIQINANATWIYQIWVEKKPENWLNDISIDNKSLGQLIEDDYITINEEIDRENKHYLVIAFKQNYFDNEQSETPTITANAYETNKIELKSFELEALDRVREYCLLTSTGGNNFAELSTDKVVNYWGGRRGNYSDLQDLPNFSNLDDDGTQDPREFNTPNPSIYSQYGLLLKTYKSDIFNNWLSRETIDGQNGILALTTIDTTDGLNLDTLNLMQKVYNALNRVLVSGNTYQDWQEVTYGEKVIRLAETPMYCGGRAYKIAFNEIIQQSATQEETTPLGTLAGKGEIISAEGDEHLVIHIEEPSIIMGIVSITPLIDYSQGNKWYLTELLNYGDLHDPNLDTIGFQNLMQEQQAWWGVTQQAGFDDLMKATTGKLPAWMNYMTDTNEIHGDFANNNKAGYMVLKRDYETDIEPNELEPSGGYGISDNTTYIDPTKFNYPFAYTELDAQNFWVQIAFDIEARRKMSNVLIPNL